MNNEITQMRPGISLGQVFKKSLNVYYKYFIDFISLSLIYAISVALIRMILKKTWGDQTFVIFITVMLNTVILCRISVALIYMASKKLFNQDLVDSSQAFEKTQGFYMNYLMVYSVVFLLMGIGFLLFIIPGFYIGTIFLFADALVVLERKNFQEAFTRSRQLVQNYFGIVFLFLMVIITISLSPIFLLKLLGPAHLNIIKNFSDLFSALFIPFYMIAQVQLYYKIKEHMAAKEIL
ncbi:MAG TPA: hypothetical protein PLH56_01060 [Candidatus Omnitrophota bacterium]|nr:hypothetical protein [Candidatus Omnitrophota bacterium]